MRGAVWILIGIASVASAQPAKPKITNTGKPVIDFVDRRGDYHLRHGNVMLNAFAVSTDAAFGATGSQDGSIVIWDLKTGRAVKTIATPHRNVWVVAVAAGGKLAASSGWDGTTRVWDVATGKEKWSTKLDSDRIAFSVDGARLVGARFEVERSWNVADGKLIFDGKPTTTRSACYDGNKGGSVAPDGRTRVERTPVGCQRVRMGDVIDELPNGFLLEVVDDAGRRKKLASGGNVGVAAIGAGARGDRIAVVFDQNLRVLEYPVGNELAKIALPNSSLRPHTAFAMSPDGKQVAMWDADDLIVWNVASASEVWRDRFVNAPGGGTPTRSVIATADAWIVLDHQKCVAREMTSGAVRWQRDRCLGAAVHPTRVLLARGPSALDIVDPKTGASLFIHAPANSPLGAIGSLAIAADGRVVASAYDQTTWLWTATGARELKATVDAWGMRPQFTSDGRIAVVAETKLGVGVFAFGADGTFASATDVPHKDRLGGGGAIVGDRLVVEEVRERDYLRLVVDLTGKVPVAKLPAWHAEPGMNLRNEALYEATFSRDLSRAYVRGGGGGAIHGWNTRTGRLFAKAPPGDVASRLVLSSDEKLLLAAYGNGGVELRDATTLALVRAFAGPKQRATAALSPDRKLVAAAALDGLFVWEAATGAVLATVDFSAAGEAPTALDFSPDGKALWIGTSLGNVHQFAVK